MWFKDDHGAMIEDVVIVVRTWQSRSGSKVPALGPFLSYHSGDRLVLDDLEKSGVVVRGFTVLAAGKEPLDIGFGQHWPNQLPPPECYRDRTHILRILPNDLRDAYQQIVVRQIAGGQAFVRADGGLESVVYKWFPGPSGDIAIEADPRTRESVMSRVIDPSIPGAPK